MPGSMGEIKPLILVVSVLALFALLMNMIPGEFYAESYEGRSADIPEYFEGVDVTSFIDTHNLTIDSAYYTSDWDLGNYHWDLGCIGVSKLILSKRNYWGPFWVGSTLMKFKNEKGIDRGMELTNTFLDTDFNSKQAYSKYFCKGENEPKVGCTIFFSFNTSDYDLPSEAWSNGELYFLQGIGFDQIGTSTNAWNIISSILFFQMPDVHPIINAIVAIPLWVCIAYLVYVLILKAIPFVGG